MLGWILVLTLRQFDVLLGVEPDDPWRWIFSAGFGVFAAAGMIWAVWLRRTRPHVYAQIGSGGHRRRRSTKPFAPTGSAW